MRSVPAVLAAVVVLTVVLFGCGGCGNGASEKPPDRSAIATHLDPATFGSLAGRALFTGESRKPRVLAMSGEPYCAGFEHTDEQLVVTDAADGTKRLKSAFVWISGGLEGKVFDYPKESVVLDQVQCMFQPHVVGVQRYQSFKFHNGDAVQHNINVAVRTKNPGWNFSLAGQGLEKEVWFPEEEPMKVICNLHSWMSAWIHVVDHPYFAVTAADGTFSIKNIPAGTYTVSCWTESCEPQRRDQKSIKITAKETTALDFSFGPRK